VGVSSITLRGDRIAVRTIHTLFAGLLLALCFAAAAAGAEPSSAPPIKGPHAKMLGAYGERQWGWTTYYHPSLHGSPTANGDKYDKGALTAAHVNLPLGTAVKVTNKKNGRSVILEINDRRPRFKRRILDVSSAAARELGMVERGIVPIVIEVIGEALPR
jgi:rare lipoprotein A